MTLPRLYIDSPLTLADQIPLNKDQSHYLSRVLRRRLGDTICLFNGRDGEWHATLQESPSGGLELRLKACVRPQQSHLDLWVVAPPLKRQEILIEKTTELGIEAFYPIVTEHTVIREVNAPRMMRWIVEAAEQSERLTLPILHPLQPLRKLLEAWPADRVLVACLERTPQTRPLQTLICQKDPPSKIGILVGPEGGLSQTEKGLLLKHPCVVSVSLGPTILRAETAAIMAVSAFAMAADRG